MLRIQSKQGPGIQNRGFLFAKKNVRFATMRLSASKWFEEAVPARKRLATLVIVIAAAAFMMSGMAGRIVDTHDSFASSDQLAAVSLILSGVPDGALPVTLLDVDDETRLGWKSEGATPHAALTLLANLASRNGAEAVLIDFDLSMDRPDMPADPALLAFLMTYPADGPLLMLVRRIGFVRSAGTAALQAATATATPYDAATAGKANIHWVTTLNDIGGDRVVRRIKMWQTVCDGAVGTAYPSAALVTAALSGQAPRHDEHLEQFLKARVIVECGAGESPPIRWPPVRRQSLQLPYVFSGEQSTSALMRLSTPKGPIIALRRISSGQLVSFVNGAATPVGEVDRDPFEGRVVIVGASYTESTDIHETPLGTMPGSLILANSIVQAQRLVTVEPAGPMLRNVMALILFLIFAAFARYLVGLAAIFGIGLVSVGVLFVVSRLYGMESGFDIVAAAITGFSLFKLIDASVQLAMDVPKRRWRAIFKA